MQLYFLHSGVLLLVSVPLVGVGILLIGDLVLQLECRQLDVWFGLGLHLVQILSLLNWCIIFVIFPGYTWQVLLDFIETEEQIYNTNKADYDGKYDLSVVLKLAKEHGKEDEEYALTKSGVEEVEVSPNPNAQLQLLVELDEGQEGHHHQEVEG